MEGLKSRAVALIVCIVLILVGWFGGSAIQAMSGGALITAKASGLKADTVVMQVGDADVTAGEYLYWLASVCDGFSQYYGLSDWSMAMTADLTVGDYAMAQADDYATQYAAVELLAKEQGIALTEEQEAVMDGMHEYYVEYYGSEEVYRYMLAYAGLNEELLKKDSAIPYLYANLCQKLLAEGGELEPTEENLAAFAERNSYTDLGEEELLSYYEDTSYGAVYDYVNDYISGLEITKTESYEAIDVASFYPALLELRSALEVPETDASSAEGSTVES